MRLLHSVLLLLFPFSIFAQDGLLDSTRQKIKSGATPEERARVIIIDGFKISETDPELALVYSNNALRDTAQISDPYLLDSIFRQRAFSYGNMNNKHKTLEAHLNRIRVLTKLDTASSKLASAYYETAHVFKSQGNDELALPYFEKCLTTSRDVGFHTQEGQVLLDLGDYAFEDENYEQAIIYINESIRIFEEDGRFLFIVGFGKAKLAQVYVEQGLKEKALKLADESVGYADTSRFEFVDYTADIFKTVGAVYLEYGMYRKAISNLQVAQDLSERNHKYFYLAETYRLLATAYREVDKDSAFLFLEWHVAFNDSVLSEKNNDRITQMRFEFEEEQREHEIKLLEQDKQIVQQKHDLAEAESDRKSSLINIIVIALVVVGGLLIWAIYLFRLARKQTKLVKAQKELVEEQKKEVDDSIAYAERIQRAVIPEEVRLKQMFPDSFVFYRPKDILSGDFYWVYDVITNDGVDLKLFGVGDCTGHGVPGALLSILGVNYLNLGAVNTHVNSPGQALDLLNSGVVQTFGHSTKTIRDGMDIVLGAVNLETLDLYYSCAKNPIYIVRNGELTILKGDKKAIGNDVAEEGFTYSDHHFKLESGDMIYAFSDGYQDQFGGPDGRKFKVKALKQMLTEVSSKTCSEQSELVETSFDNWIGDYEQIDDVALLGIRV